MHLGLVGDSTCEGVGDGQTCIEARNFIKLTEKVVEIAASQFIISFHTHDKQHCQS